jgi:hypothetical protein
VGPACQRPTMAHGRVSQPARTCGDTAVARPLPATSSSALLAPVRCLPTQRPWVPRLYLHRPWVEAKDKFAYFPCQLIATSLLSSVHQDVAPLHGRLLPHQAAGRCRLRVSSSPQRCAILQPLEQLALRHGPIPVGSPLGEASATTPPPWRPHRGQPPQATEQPRCRHLEHLHGAALPPGPSNGFPDHGLEFAPLFVTVCEGLTVTRCLRPLCNPANTPTGSARTPGSSSTTPSPPATYGPRSCHRFPSAHTCRDEEPRSNVPFSSLMPQIGPPLPLVL